MSITAIEAPHFDAEAKARAAAMFERITKPENFAKLDECMSQLRMDDRLIEYTDTVTHALSVWARGGTYNHILESAYEELRQQVINAHMQGVIK